MQPHEMTPAQLILSFIILLIIASITAYYADRKGRSFTGWFILGVLLGIFAPLILFFLPSYNQNKEGEGTLNYKPVIAADKSSPPPVPHLDSDEKLWYYLDADHKQMGPVSVVALRDLWNRGLLELTSYVWSEGMVQWSKVEELPELKNSLNKESVY
ncbi:MAG: DUF4339 domain-containing protein [Parachlamydia sp.]|jgi:MFS family permease|nr:DUF4339 domain-containing protein [Parachlamydia sp.]